MCVCVCPRSSTPVPAIPAYQESAINLESGTKKKTGPHVSKPRSASSNNPAVMAYNAVLVLFDVLVFLVKAIYIVGKGVFEMAVLPPARDVSGDIVLITGAGHGMGKNLSLQYAALGATVVCVDVNEKTNQETVTAIKSKGGKAFGYT